MRQIAATYVLVAFALSSSAQDSSISVAINQNTYVDTAVEIMRVLDIPIRPNYRKDPTIEFYIKNIQNSGETLCMPVATMDSNVVYDRIIIWLHPRIYNNFLLKDGSENNLFARSTLIHELVHVLQYPDTNTRKDLSHPMEQAAFAVQGHFALRVENPNVFNLGMSTVYAKSKEEWRKLCYEYIVGERK